MLRKGFFVCGLVLLSWWHFAAYASAPEARQYFRDGYLAATAREWDAAISLYTKAIELDRTNPEIYLQRAAAHQMAGHIDLAIADYEKALELKPDYYLALEYLAKLYETKGYYDRAINLYTRALPLVTDSKWRSVVKWWISQAKSKCQQPSQHRARAERGRGHVDDRSRR
jgi:tetratricopeptide (TPR) repeat protein